MPNHGEGVMCGWVAVARALRAHHKRTSTRSPALLFWQRQASNALRARAVVRGDCKVQPTDRRDQQSGGRGHHSPTARTCLPRGRDTRSPPTSSHSPLNGQRGACILLS